MDVLRDEGFNPYMIPSNKKSVFLDRRGTMAFLEYIGECPVECYSYKWDAPPVRNKPSKYFHAKRIGYVAAS